MFRQDNRKRRAFERKIDSVEIDRNVDYPHRLNFYYTPPLQEVTVEEFEQWAIDRLRVLNELEICEAKGQWVEDKPNGGSLGQVMKPVLDKYLPLSSGFSGKNKAAVIEQERKKDHYSHFILRLAFSRSENLRNRFIRLEKELFKLRYYTDMVNERQEFIKSLNFAWVPVGEEEKRHLEETQNWSMPEKEYFKLEFENVADLVERRQVFLHKGKAYVPISLQQDLVFNQFTKELDRALLATGKALPRLDEDGRLVKILHHLAEGGLPSNRTKINIDSEITADQVDELAVKHFPMCMRHMHLSARSRHHAYYDNRTQYGLFLKGIGLSVEESLKFWRSIFNTLTDDQYKKQNYSYNIRHSYGLEGSRNDYKSKDCIEIIRSTDMSKHAGCPFRGLDMNKLIDELRSMGITDTQEIGKIKDLVSKNRHHVACGMVYEFTHKNDTRQLEHTIHSPIEYFQRSFSLEKEES